ncbi:MAG: hypothetical protein HKN03_15470 [Acidimicrobiales bacterium]|nr:hypothetical protein [Acidimicrobiales bacterium]
MRFLRILVLSAVAVSAVLLGFSLWANTSSPPHPTGTAETAVVEFVIDGDTVDLIIDGQQERVRLIGVDTPESVSRDTPVQCYGAEASAALTGLLPINSVVRIERDAEVRDRFGRVLLYLYRADPTTSDGEIFVNEWLLANGFADTLFFEPNTTYRSQFTRSRNTARDAGLGLWGVCEGPDQPLS